MCLSIKFCTNHKVCLLHFQKSQNCFTLVLKLHTFVQNSAFFSKLCTFFLLCASSDTLALQKRNHIFADFPKVTPITLLALIRGNVM
jgi:hypothetical protein